MLLQYICNKLTLADISSSSKHKLTILSLYDSTKSRYMIICYYGRALIWNLYIAAWWKKIKNLLQLYCFMELQCVCLQMEFCFHCQTDSTVQSINLFPPDCSAPEHAQSGAHKSQLPCISHTYHHIAISRSCPRLSAT